MLKNKQASEASSKRRCEQDKAKLYIRAYQQNPETKEEIETARVAAIAILSGESW